MFRITKSSSSNALVLKKPCGCLLKLEKKKNTPTVIESEENFQPIGCACQRVTNWANTWIKLPYCQRNVNNIPNNVPNKENLTPNSHDQNALYATIDVSRKKKNIFSNDCSDIDLVTVAKCQTQKNTSQCVEIDDGPLANYENLNFALSLEYYENAKDVLRKAGVTQAELDAISSNLKPVSYMIKNKNNSCTKCGHSQRHFEFNKSQSQETITSNSHDDYLMMEPNTKDKHDQNKSCLPPGYTPMSPISNFAFHTLKHSSKSAINRLIEEKSASNPSLIGPSIDRGKKLFLQLDTNEKSTKPVDDIYSNRSKDNSIERVKHRKRSCSADSSRFLEDVKEFDSSVDSRGSSSSLETLRNMAIDSQRTSTPYATQDSNIAYCEDADCCAKSDTKNSDVDSSDASKDLPQLRSKIKPGTQIKRSSSVPFKAGPNRDSSSSNDSGVSSCSLKHGPEFIDFELPLTTAHTRYHYLSVQRRSRGMQPSCIHVTLPRRSKSTDPLREITSHLQKVKIPAKSSSAEAEVPVLPVKTLRGIDQLFD